MAGNIQVSYQWAIDTCNKKNVGYSQTYRNQQTVNGITIMIVVRSSGMLFWHLVLMW